MNPTFRLLIGDCVVRMADLPTNSVGAVVCDPPYGLEFMNCDWDRLWQTGAGMSKPGIGDRPTAWVSFGGLSPFGGANPSCLQCGGRLRGGRKCSCENPEWHIRGERVVPGEAARKQAQGMQAWHQGWLEQVHHVLWPGGVVKAFGGSRTYHRLAAAMENAGFTDVQMEAWIYGSGFPKSHNIAVYMDRMLTEGRSRQVLRRDVGNLNGRFADAAQGFVSQSKAHEVQTPEARAWLGWGTALKPAWEPVVVGFKP